MKKLMLVLVLLMSLGQSGCQFIGGATAGAVGTGADYEYGAYRPMEKLEDDYLHERISRKEYETRKAHIESGSVLYWGR